MNTCETSSNAIAEALTVLSKLPTFAAIIRELEIKAYPSLQILIEFGRPDDGREYGQTSKEIGQDNISNDTIDFNAAYREINAPQALWDQNLWGKLFYGKHVRHGARVFLVRVREHLGIFVLAETIAHEIGAHVRGAVLGIFDHHGAWGAFSEGSAIPGTRAQKILDELHAYFGAETNKDAKPLTSPH